MSNTLPITCEDLTFRKYENREYMKSRNFEIQNSCNLQPKFKNHYLRKY